MPAKRTVKPKEKPDCPKDLSDHPFFGLTLDEDQAAFRGAVWSDDIDIVFVDAAAGSGKTTVAVATSVLLCKYEKFRSIVYVMHPIADRQGFLPGTIEEKSSVYFDALFQALFTANEFPDRAIISDTTQKEGTGYIQAITDSYLRGSNIGASDKTILIVDEAQNFDEFSLRKVLTRACEGTKVIVIGHHEQCDLPGGHASGFAKCMRHFWHKQNPRFAFCRLRTCHRSLVARVADENWDDEE